MKALFCYDGPMYKDENGHYYDSILNDQMFERYFKVADKLELIIRMRPTEAGQATKRMNKLSNPDISVCEFPNLSSIKGLIIGTRDVKELLRRKIKEADLVFIRVPSVIGNLSVDVCKEQKKPYLVEVVGCPWDSYRNYSLKGKMVAPFAAVTMRNRIKDAPFVLYVTNEFLQKRYPSHGKQINCSNVELKPTSEDILERRLNRIESYEEKSKLIIGTAAGLDVLYKGQQYIIQALGMLKKQGNTCFEYQLIGGGTGDYLLKVAEACDVLDQVHLIGQVPHDGVFDWMDGIDIYAQPSRQEGLPRSMIEAMSRGLPCIGANTAGIPELVDSRYIFSNSRTEVSEIVDMLLRLSENHSELMEMARLNFNEAQKYQRDVLVDRRTMFFKAYAKEICNVE